MSFNRLAGNLVVLVGTSLIGCVTVSTVYRHLRFPPATDTVVVGSTLVQERAPMLIPEPMDLVRRGIPLSFNFSDLPRAVSGECSCQNPDSDGDCCFRSVKRSHKFGSMLVKTLLRGRGRKNIAPRCRLFADDAKNNYLLTRLPASEHYSDTDFREVLVMRSIYSALVSGYQYHKSGKECWLSPYGKPGYKTVGGLRDGDWQPSLSYQPGPPAANRDLCQYLAENSDEIGMRAYIDWAMRVKYATVMSNWALAREFEVLRDRTLTVCFEDLSSSDSQVVEKTVIRILDFLYNKRHPQTWSHKKGVVGEYSGGHSTSHDEALHEHMVQVIKLLDEEYYNWEIAFAHSILPCKGDGV